MNLRDKKEIEGLRTYLRTRRPACGIITIPWFFSSLCEIGGQVALFQLNNNSHFIAETPQGSGLLEFSIWRKVLAHPRTQRCVMNQCMTNLRDRETKRRISKLTDFLASDEVLLKDLRPLQCDGKRHAHLTLANKHIGRRKTYLARTWPWELASIVAAGVSELIKRIQLKTYVMAAYPIQDRTREAAARDAIRRETRTLESASDSTETEYISLSESVSTPGSTSTVEELKEEEMTDTERTEAPFSRRLPYHPVTCPACRREEKRLNTT